MNDKVKINVVKENIFLRITVLIEEERRSLFPLDDGERSRNIGNDHISVAEVIDWEDNDNIKDER